MSTASLCLNSLHHVLSMNIGLIWFYTEEGNPSLPVRHTNSSLNSKRQDPILSFTLLMDSCYLNNCHDPCVTDIMLW